MKILKKAGAVEKKGEEETKYMPHVPVKFLLRKYLLVHLKNIESPVLPI
jgi:hypothetical protein